MIVIDENRVSAALIRTAFEKNIREYESCTGYVCENIPASVDGGENLALSFLQEHTGIDGIICANDLIAIGVLNVLKEKGVSVPRQVSILGENNSAFCETCRPRLTSLDTMIGMSSIMAARTLMDVLEGREPSHRVILQMTIVERGTT